MYGIIPKSNAERQREFREKRAALHDEAFAALNREAALCLAVEKAIQRGALPSEIRDGKSNGAVVENLIRYLTATPEKVNRPKTRQSRTP
jgi:hypothetical protein